MNQGRSAAPDLERSYENLVSLWTSGVRDYHSLLSDYLTANSIFVAAIGFLLARQPATNTYLLHLVDYHYGQALKNVPADFRVPAGFRLAAATVKRPAAAAVTLSLSRREGVVRLLVPELITYALIVLRLERI